MTADYKSFADALEVAHADIRGNFPGASISDDSMFHLFASLFTTARMGSSAYAKQRYNATRPDLATGDDLDELAAKYGLTRKPATTARGLSLSVTVTSTGSWASGMAMTTTSGLAFETTSAGAWTSGGTQYLEVDSTTTGVTNNLPTSAEVTITSPPANMESTATMSSWLTSHARARDRETDAELQKRLADTIGGMATSANGAAYRAWILDEDCDRELLDGGYDIAQEAYIYPQARAALDVTAVPVLAWDGIQKRPSVAGFHTTIETFVTGEAPPGVDFDSVIFTEDAQSMRVTIETTTGYGRDWGSAATSNLTTSATPGTTTRLNLTAAPSTESLEAGDWLICHVGSNYFPNVRQVVSVNNSSNWVEVSETFKDESGNDVIPSTSIAVRPAGPCTQSVVDNLLALYGLLSPSDTVDAIRYPPIDQSHPVDLTTAMISRAVLDADTEHIYDVTINSGTAVCTASAVAGGVLVAYILSPTRADDWLRVEFSSLNG